MSSAFRSNLTESEVGLRCERNAHRRLAATKLSSAPSSAFKCTEKEMFYIPKKIITISVPGIRGVY